MLQVQKEAIKLKSLPILVEYLKHSTDGTVLRFVLNIIAAFLDHGEEVRGAVNFSILIRHFIL